MSQEAQNFDAENLTPEQFIELVKTASDEQIVEAIHATGTEGALEGIFVGMKESFRPERAGDQDAEITWVVVDAPKVDAKNVPQTIVAATAPTAYVRFHGRNASTWNKRGGGAAERFDYLYSEDELREWVEPLRELGSDSEEAYAFFNNNNQTNGVAQAPAGAQLMRNLLEEQNVPVA